MRHKTRLLNQLTTTLKEYYPRPLEAFENIETEVALDFLTRYPTPAHLSALKRKEFNRFATQQHHLSKQRCEQLWEKLQKPQLAVPEHVVIAKAQQPALFLRPHAARDTNPCAGDLPCRHPRE